MTVKKKKLYLVPSFSRKISRYRHVGESSSYLPHVFNRDISRENAQNLVILDEQEGNSSGE